jgi:MFS family permease
VIKSRNGYLLAISSWYAAFGMQSVLFAWLVTIVLRESAERVGLAQMSVLLPGLFLILIAGVLADRIGQKRQAIWSQLFAGVLPLLLICALLFDALSYPVMIVYALLMGIAQAFLTPARDGLLNLVAGQNVQRMVMLTSLCQFGFQILGYTLAGFADTVGPIYILSFQSVILLLGTWGFFRLGAIGRPAVVAKKDRETVLKGLWEGASTVLGNPVMRAVLIQNIAMGFFFMGSFIVAFPLAIREVFAGSSADLAGLNALNSLGLVLTILVLLRVGYVSRAGRALILAQGIGSLVLMSAGFVANQIIFTGLVFVWGICGGLAMPMSRTLLQQLAPANQRGRVMSFYAFSFMGAGPFGALLNGYVSDLYGPQQAIIFSGLGMIIVLIVVTSVSPLWRNVIVADEAKPS